MTARDDYATAFDPDEVAKMIRQCALINRANVTPEQAQALLDQMRSDGFTTLAASIAFRDCSRLVRGFPSYSDIYRHGEAQIPRNWPSNMEA